MKNIVIAVIATLTLATSASAYQTTNFNSFGNTTTWSSFGSSGYSSGSCSSFGNTVSCSSW